LPITTFWVGEYSSTDTSDAPEFAVADAIVSLCTEREAERDRRVLSVIKLRGSSSLSGKHAYRLSSTGIHVFPRMADPSSLTAMAHAGTHVLRRPGVGCHAV
jgi:circadian clock protein KaiC